MCCVRGPRDREGDHAIIEKNCYKCSNLSLALSLRDWWEEGKGVGNIACAVSDGFHTRHLCGPPLPPAVSGPHSRRDVRPYPRLPCRP